ncbi:ArsR family transcriptional regulator [bacterium]|nr:MAG: ArsR family transcriptional regulator [bacterium]
MREELRVYKALSDLNRIRIIKMLEVKPLCGCGIANVLNIVQSAISRHLKILEDADLITHERDGNYIVYSLNRGTGSVVAAFQLEFIKNRLNDDPIIAEDKRKAVNIDKCDFAPDLM